MFTRTRLPAATLVFVVFALGCGKSDAWVGVWQGNLKGDDEIDIELTIERDTDMKLKAVIRVTKDKNATARTVVATEISEFSDFIMLNFPDGRDDAIFDLRRQGDLLRGTFNVDDEEPIPVEFSRVD